MHVCIVDKWVHLSDAERITSNDLGDFRLVRSVSVVNFHYIIYCRPILRYQYRIARFIS